MIRVADYIMKRIAEEGVSHLFYVPGGQCVYLCDALRRSEELTPIAMHHEQAAAMAALAYSKYNNIFGACMVTTGCAGTNTLTGVLHAWQDNVPCLVVSGQQTYSQTIKESGLPLRQVGVQEADIETIVSPITKYAVTVSDPKEIGYHMDKAIYLATHGRKGPVWIDVPLDVQNSMINEDSIRRMEQTEIENRVNELKNDEYYENIKPADEDLKYVFDSIKEAKRPVILFGNAIRTSNSVDLFKKLVNELKIPVVSTKLASDILDYDDEYYYGILSGLTGGADRYANFIIQNSDFILAIGTRLSVDTTGSEFDQFAREAKVIVVDIDKVEHSKRGIKIDKLILSNARLFIESFSEYINKNGNSIGYESLNQWIEKCNHWKEIFPLYEESDISKNPINSKYAMWYLSEHSPKGTVFVSDAGFTGASAPVSTHIVDGKRFIHSFAQGEMGFSVPGAIGVSSQIGAPVVAYTGDGSLMMNLQEFQTIVRNSFNLKIVIMNNNGYSGVRHGQKAHFRGKSIGVDPETGVDFPDYGRLADAFGINYRRVQNIEELSDGVENLFKDDSPMILEIDTDPEQFDLHNGLVKYGKRNFGFRPIEDQSPYIDRDLFFNEMIIEPLETSHGTPV